MLKALQTMQLVTKYQRYNVRARLEGESREGWVLADYGDVVVHLFSPERRNYYRLEDLWSQGKVLIRLQ